MSKKFLNQVDLLEDCYKTLARTFGEKFGYQPVQYGYPDPVLSSSDCFFMVNNTPCTVTKSYIIKLYISGKPYIKFYRKRGLLFMESLYKIDFLDKQNFKGIITIDDMVTFAKYFNHFVCDEILCKNAQDQWEYKDEYYLWLLQT